MQTVRTVSFPDQQLLDDLSPLPAGLRGAVWDLETEPDGGTLAEIDGVILPYIGAGAVLGSLSKVEQLKFVQTQSTGYDGVIEAAGPAAGVANASGVHAAATAELAIGLILAKLRGIDQAVRDQQYGLWRPERRQSLADRKVLLVGVGGIGHEIARRLEPFEVTITRVGSSARTDEHGQVHASSELAALAASHDILVSVLPLNEHTHQLIGEEVLAALPDGALVVNVGRGSVVDTAALTKEVLSGRLQCAIDVVDPEPLPEDHPLWSTTNALITPHVGGNASAFQPRILKLLRKQLDALAAGKTPANLVQAGPFA
ncbi:D-isomer specific 2-hydroxyacid dehydrogenase,NAD binding domain protein [Pseudarthrobacter siccitolerans]|uniref:D-isomer specific 2-hydroxyacid dehydrogenase,NAD binding domain protein n=1 Tax=Pseudarthrobacter siccitolerans TaxID=861266 RepID=A0A024GY87_9MICC|nr:2-hydroxyacid dehydrogenase [Pseudarthrobacter siccitolerans]CCQ44572.1 D-isomer specific 2-hydroxyacid dehydrogenase,NAD binding domain protein [Pseudarthrobacter siccitolerans]